MSRRLELARQPVHVPGVGVGPLGVARHLVVARAAGEVTGGGVVGAGQRAVRHAVTVDVAVARPLAGELLQVLLGEDLAAVELLLRVLELGGHPEVHSEVEVGEHEHRCLEAIGVVERVARELVALFDRAGQQDHVLGVAVRKRVDEPDVRLRRARRQAGRRADALDVEDHDRHLRVVREAGELRHQRDARAGRRGHRPRARPARADGHADRGQLVLGLHDRDPLLALAVAAESVGVGDQVLAERGRRGDGVPRHDRDPAHQGADRGRLVAFDQDLALDHAGHRLEAVRVLLGEVVLPVVEPHLDGVEVDLDRLGLGQELAADTVLDGLPRDAEHAGDHAYVDHVRQLLSQRVALDLRLGELGEGNRVVGHVSPHVGRREHLFVDHDPARAHGLEVLAPGGDVEGDQDVDLVRARHVPFGRDPKLVPRRKAFDVGGKDVFGGDWDTHVEDRPGQYQVGGLAA